MSGLLGLATAFTNFSAIWILDVIVTVLVKYRELQLRCAYTAC